LAWHSAVVEQGHDLYFLALGFVNIVHKLLLDLIKIFGVIYVSHALRLGAARTNDEYERLR
jgi:hypothetical protein